MNKNSRAFGLFHSSFEQDAPTGSEIASIADGTRYESIKKNTDAAKWSIYLVSLTSFIWLTLWFCINTGPWALTRVPKSLIGWLHYLRAALPVFYCLTFFFAVLAKKSKQKQGIAGSIKSWLIYGIFGLLACLVSPRPVDAAYWAASYLSPILILIYFLQDENPLSRAVSLNYLSWFITTAFLLVMLYAAREELFVDYRFGLTGYGIEGRVKSVFDMAMSRSSGLARFAAVPGIVAFVFILGGRGFFRLLWVALFVGSATLIYLMQSRGSFFAFFFSLFFIMLFMGHKTRRFGAIFLVLFGIIYHLNIIPEKRIEQISQHILREQDEEGLLTLTGRAHTWERAWVKIKKSPIIGWGPQADRFLIREHTHNTYIYALFTSGFLGAAAFVWGLVLSWAIIYRILRSGIAKAVGHQTFFIQTIGILTFFTVRSIPEVSGAMFGVDLMVMLPAMAYLGILDQEIKKIERPGSIAK